MGDKMSQSEIDALLNSVNSKTPSPAASSVKDDQNILSAEEKDALGEIGNISMGTAATTLSQLLNKSVMIDTPKVEMITKKELKEHYPTPYVAVEIKYTKGLVGDNLLNIKNDDVKLMTDLMMGGPGNVTEGEINDMHLSAMGEVMNQMIGSSCTSLAQMFKKRIDISPPKPFIINYADDDAQEVLGDNDKMVRVLFKLTIGDLLESEIMQILPFDFAKEMVEILMESYRAASMQKPKEPVKVTNTPKEPKPSQSTAQYQEPAQSRYVEKKKEVVNAKKIRLPDFEEETKVREASTPIDLLLDVPLQVTVELGKTKRQIKDILKFNIGTIIELNKIAGEAVDIVINGKTVGKGEVVVIDEAYGVRITEVIRSEDRIHIK